MIPSWEFSLPALLLRLSCLDIGIHSKGTLTGRAKAYAGKPSMNTQVNALGHSRSFPVSVPTFFPSRPLSDKLFILTFPLRPIRFFQGDIRLDIFMLFSVWLTNQAESGSSTQQGEGPKSSNVERAELTMYRMNRHSFASRPSTETPSLVGPYLDNSGARAPAETALNENSHLKSASATLMGIAAELRQQIYSYLAFEDRPTVISVGAACRPYRVGRCDRSRLAALNRANRQLHAETSTSLYTDSRVIIDASLHTNFKEAGFRSLQKGYVFLRKIQHVRFRMNIEPIWTRIPIPRARAAVINIRTSSSLKTFTQQFGAIPQQVAIMRRLRAEASPDGSTVWEKQGFEYVFEVLDLLETNEHRF